LISIVVQNKNGSINITNGISGQISAAIGINKGSNQSAAFYPIQSGKSETWTRNYNNEYQCFISDPDKFLYGFIVSVGGNYTYQGQGKLWDNHKKILAEEDDLNLSSPGYVIVKAFECNVNVTLTGGNDQTFTINKNEYVRFSRKVGNYVLKFTDLKGLEKKYLVSTGRSYYIYNFGSVIDKDSNIVLPLYSENTNSVVTYDDENINKIVEFNGGSSSWQQWSSSYSSQTQINYSQTTFHSSSIQSNSHFSQGSNFINMGDLDINEFKGMTGGKIMISGFDENLSSFKQMSGTSTQTKTFSSESFSSETHFQSSNYQY
jgi:hypothetical protein